ncbi:MAG: GNAT family N-acetyltransferase [Candidatus Bipolaricaulota bacterium]
MKNKIREGSEGDIPEILRLNKKLADQHAKTDNYFLPGSETRKAVKDWLESVFEDDSALVLVVEEGDGLGGYFIGLIEQTKPFIRPDFEGRISDAYLEPRIRGKGFARLAYERFQEWFKDNDINSIRLSVHSENEDAISAWRSLGFEEYMKRMKVDI